MSPREMFTVTRTAASRDDLLAACDEAASAYYGQQPHRRRWITTSTLTKSLPNMLGLPVVSHEQYEGRAQYVPTKEER